MGTVYLIHLDEPFGHARHYMGYTGGESMAARLARHRRGDGAKMLRHVANAGIGFEVVRTWRKDPVTGKAATRATERRFKSHRNPSRLCPLCRAAKAEREGRLRRERREGRVEKLSVPWALDPEEREERRRIAQEELDAHEAFDDIPF